MNTRVHLKSSLPNLEHAKPFERPPEILSDLDMQSELLEGVSRTFALTIPRLPNQLYPVVSNAYLLCRIIDTIEDEVSLNAQQKREFCTRFIGVVKAMRDAEGFSSELAPLLSAQTIPAEHELIRLTPRVIRITHSFNAAQRHALSTCVETMAGGMPRFQSQELKAGLENQNDMDRYCYYVAGCVGEMLTRLFCDYSAEIANHEQELLKLSVSFGQGLQMTNIIKDIWDDHRRSVCWLPRDLFEKAGFDLARLSPENHGREFCQGLESLVAIAHGHLKNALEYTLLIPKHETGIREFCLWALGMAVLTLKKIKANPDFSASAQVKISRRAVQYTIFATRLVGRSDLALKALFKLVSLGLGEGGRGGAANHRRLNSN